MNLDASALAKLDQDLAAVDAVLTDLVRTYQVLARDDETAAMRHCLALLDGLSRGQADGLTIAAVRRLAGATEEQT